jgi:cell division protein FtsB
MKYLKDEIATLQKSMDKLKEQAAASEERIQRLKKELGFTYPAEPFISLNNNTTDYYMPVPILRSSISRFSV